MSSARVFGTGIHSAVERHFQASLSGDPKPDLDALLVAYRSAWLPHDPAAIQFGSTELGPRWMLWPHRVRLLGGVSGSGKSGIRKPGRFIVGIREVYYYRDSIAVCSERLNSITPRLKTPA